MEGEKFSQAQSALRYILQHPTAPAVTAASIADCSVCEQAPAPVRSYNFV